MWALWATGDRGGVGGRPLAWAPSRCSGLGASLRLSHGGPPLEARPRKGAGPRKGAWGEGRGPRGGGGGAGGWVARRRRRNFCGPCTNCFFGDLCGPSVGYARAPRGFGRLASGRGRPSRSGWLELAGGGRGSVQGHGFADARFPRAMPWMARLPAASPRTDADGSDSRGSPGPSTVAHRQEP